MSDAKDDDLTRIDDWAEAPTTSIMPIEALPVELLQGPNTDRHRLQESADFLAGREIGRAEGYARGLADGRADVRAQDLEDGRAEILDAFRRALIAEGTDPSVALMMKDRLREWARKHPAG